MSDYEDIHGNSYKIESSQCEPDAVYVEFMSNNPGRWIAGEDAPAVALAILEAAGHPLRTYQPGEMRDLADVAHDSLKRHLVLREEHAAREAEDAKVRAWWDETRYGHTTSLCWGHMGESAHEDVRKQYRLARKFFEES